MNRPLHYGRGRRLVKAGPTMATSFVRRLHSGSEQDHTRVARHSSLERFTFRPLGRNASASPVVETGGTVIDIGLFVFETGNLRGVHQAT